MIEIWPLNPERIPVPSGERVEVDGVDAHRTVVVECWAHQGAPKPAQRNKVLSHAFKLSWIGTLPACSSHVGGPRFMTWASK